MSDTRYIIRIYDKKTTYLKIYAPHSGMISFSKTYTRKEAEEAIAKFYSSEKQ